MLATSRTPFHAYGEHEYPLSPLPLPDLAHLPTVEGMSQYEAVRLFIERAQAVQTGLRRHHGQCPGGRRDLFPSGWVAVGD